MANHFSAIGFTVGSEIELVTLARKLAPFSESIAVEGGRYLHWSSASDAEVWLQLDGGKKIIGMNPHFSGNSTVRVGLTHRLPSPGPSPLDGAFHAWANPPEKDPGSGDYPFVFDCPNILCYTDAQLPGIAHARITAFAHDIDVFDSVETYDSTPSTKPKLASKSFIPSGLFLPSGEKTLQPQARGILTGHVRRATRLTNEESSLDFHWAEVESYGGIFDVVIDPAILKNDPRVGGVISGSFWLSGQLTEYARPRTGLLRRFLGSQRAG